MDSSQDGGTTMSTMWTNNPVGAGKRKKILDLVQTFLKQTFLSSKSLTFAYNVSSWSVELIFAMGPSYIQ